MIALHIQFFCFLSQSKIYSFNFIRMLFFVALEKFWHKWRRHHCRQRAADLLLDLFLSFMAIEHWGFFSVPHILLYGTFVYKVISEDLWRSRMLPTVICGTDITFVTAYICRLWNSNTQPFVCQANTLTDCVIAVTYSEIQHLSYGAPEGYYMYVKLRCVKRNA